MKQPKEGEAVIILGAREQHQAIVSAEDYAALARWRWTFKVSAWKFGNGIYARRCVWRDGKKKTILMHDVILTELMGIPRPSELHTADHRNGDTLDNTRGNLRWATKSEQGKNRRKCSSEKRPAVDVAAVLASYEDRAA